MKNAPLPKIEPLINSINELNIGEFLKSREFKRYLIKAKLDEYWRDAYEHVRKTRTYVSLGTDHEKYDSIDTFSLVSNELYTDYLDNFFYFIRDFLYAFGVWKKEDQNLDEIIEDLELLSSPNEIIEYLTNELSNFHSKPVSNSEIPKTIWNSEKLEQYLNNMDKSIKNKEYNLTLTYAYSCLEGMFKAYVNKHIPENREETDLSKLSKLVKNHLIENFNENDIKYPEQIINLIGTITNAVSNARNSFSDSHFNNASDKWLAEFVKDCVNSIGRLIINLTK